MHGENLWKFTETRPRAPRARHASILPRSKVQYHGMHTAQPRPGTATPASARPARAAHGDGRRHMGVEEIGHGVKGFERVVNSSACVETILVMEAWVAPRPLARVWCLYEALLTVLAAWRARAGQHAAHDRPASGGGRGAGGRGRGRRRAGAARAGRGGRGGGGGDDGRGQGGHLRSGGAPAAACLAAHCGDEGDA
jgi:hypothetical protein